MKKLTVAFVRSVIDQQFKEEISYSRMVELLNEEVNSEPYCACVPEPREEIGRYTAWHCERCKKEVPEPQQAKTNVFKRDECIFQYCPHPDLCKDNCQNNRHGQ